MQGFGQDSIIKDIITITDYTNLLVTVDATGELLPVTERSGLQQAGFFLTKPDDGQIRVCPGEEVIFVWVDGQLFQALDSCKIFDPAQFFEFATRDTLYIAFSSNKGLGDFICDLINFREKQVIKSDPAIERVSGSHFGDFVISAMLFIFIFYSISIKAFPSRVRYIIEKSFTLKESAYEFVNTSFMSGPSFYLVVLLSLILGFCGVYFQTILEGFWAQEATSFWFYQQLWLQITLWVLMFIYLKWFLILTISKLFHFRGVSDYQLFDFLNSTLFLLIPIFLFCLSDFALNTPTNSWVSEDLLKVFPLILIFVVFWFTLKFVSISPSKKLSIISYLCATEMIPAITLLVWFYK